MGKTATGGVKGTTILGRTSESSQNQGFLNLFGKKASHGQAIARLDKSRKGLKSGEPFSSAKHTNHLAKKG
jgi:hypothetical protein